MKLIILIFLTSKVFGQDFLNLTRYPRATTCGVSSKDSGLIVGGKIVEKGDFPWMAALMQRGKNNVPTYFCGGILISSTKVLTAAHCILNKQSSVRKLERDIKIYLGMYDLNDRFEDFISITPQKIILHPSWNPYIEKYIGDIAVLQLEKSITFSRNILPICLLDPDEVPNVLRATVVGYGKSESDAVHENIPKMLQVPIISTNRCINEDPLFATISSHTTFCAGSANGEGPCLGDSGNGVFYKHNNKFYLLGIVSASFADRTNGNCDVSKYALYTDVSKFRDWIDNPSEDYQSNSFNTQLNPNFYHQPMINKQCGMVKIRQKRIVKGKDAARGQFPWLATIMRRGDGLRCGGTLISKKLIVTTAHCIQEKNQSQPILPREIYVLLGSFDLNDVLEKGKKIVLVNEIHIHPDWNIHTESNDADIALLELEKSFTFSEYIQPICLWESPNKPAQTFGVIAGYGQSEDDSKSHENFPKVADVPIHTQEKCFLNNYNLARFSSERTFCGGKADGTGVCFGDNGNGLAIKSGNNYYLRGILSAALSNGFSCDVNNYAIYTDVLKFSEWIKFYM